MAMQTNLILYKEIKKVAVAIGLLAVMVSAFSADYQVNQPCEQEGVLARAIAKDAGAFSGAPIALVCFDGRFEFAQVSKFDADKCLHVIARRDGKDTDVAVKSLDGKPICSE